MLVRRRFAPTATMIITPTRVRRTAFTGRIGLWTACSSALAPGTTDIGAAATGVVVTTAVGTMAEASAGAAGTVMIGVDVDFAETGIVTAGAVASSMAIAGFALNMDFATAMSSTAIEGSTGMAVSTEIEGAFKAVMAGATNFSAFQISSSGNGWRVRLPAVLLE